MSESKTHFNDLNDIRDFVEKKLKERENDDYYEASILWDCLTDINNYVMEKPKAITSH